MKKRKLLGASLLLVLVITLIAALSVFAFADETPTASWDETNFGNAKWTAIADATQYKVALYFKETGKEDVEVVTRTTTDNSYDFIPKSKTGGDITVDKTGDYYFVVTATVDPEGEDATTTTLPASNVKSFRKLWAPRAVRWDITSTSINATWDKNGYNDVSDGYPADNQIKYELTFTYTKGTNSKILTTDPGDAFMRMAETLDKGKWNGEIIFSIRALSDFAFDSDVTEMDPINALTYPVTMVAPKSVSWGKSSEFSAGIANWQVVPGADQYIVNFYQAVPVYADVYFKTTADGSRYIVTKDYEPQEGETVNPKSVKMIVGYDYTILKSKDGKPDQVVDASSEVENQQCDISNVNIKENGVYLFSVVTYGSNNAIASAPAGFDKSKFPDKHLYKDTTYTTTNGTVLFKTEEYQHNQLLDELASYGYETEDSSNSPVVFDFVRTDYISVKGTADDESANLVLRIAKGISKTITVDRYINSASSDKATIVPISPKKTQNSSAIDFATDGDEITINGVNEGTVNMVLTAKHSPYKGRQIKVIVYSPPASIEITGEKNSFSPGDTFQFKLNVEPSTASKDPDLYTWASTDSTVITRIENGNLAITENTLSQDQDAKIYTISVKAENGVSDTFTIMVSNNGIMPGSIVIIGGTSVAMKSSLQLSANVYSTDKNTAIGPDSIYVSNKDVTWKSDNETVATVDQTGKVTPKGLGKCNIIAASKQPGYEHIKDSKQIEVVKEKVAITKLSLTGTKTLTVGQTTDVKLSVSPSNATYQDSDLVWRVNGGGTITTKTELIRTLAATAEGSATVSVYYRDAPSIKSEFVVTVKTASEKPTTDVGKSEVITDVKPVAGTGDKKSEYTAELNKAVIDEAIEKVFTEAIPKKTTPYVRVKVNTAATAASMTVKIPYYSVEKIINYYSYRNKGHLVIETGIGVVDIPPYALREIYEQSSSSSTIDIRMVRVVNTNLNEYQQKAAGKQKVYEYQIINGGKEITYFDGYSINIGIPFALTSNQSGKGAQVDHMDTNGYLSTMSTTYDYTKKLVSFDTTHLSYYIPYYYAADAWDNPFTDVRKSDWYYDSVFYVVDRGLMRGISAERFVPASYTTRAMVVTILHRLSGTPAPKSTNTFVDVKDEQWYTEAVLWATEEGLVKGYGNKKFGPNDQVTREQLAVMLHNYAKYVDVTPKYGWDTPMKYSDASKIPSWAQQGAMYCQITNIIGGKQGGRFDPKGVASRCELSTMLLRMNDQMEAQLAEEKE